MSNSIDRAKEALNVSSDYELAKILGITHSAVAGYRRRENSLPLAQCLKVSELAGKTLDWLILGKGSDTDTASKKSVTSIPNIVLVPLYDVPVSAGHGSFFDTENIIQQIPFDTEWLDGVFVLRLNGALRIKRLQWLADGRLRISSDNPIYETEYVDPNTPPDDFAIIGFCHTKIGRVV